MKLDFSISSKVFNSILNIDVEQICTLSPTELRLVLPCLVRMSLIAPLDTTPECTENRRAVLKILSDIDSVNGIIGLLSVDFHGLELDVKQEHASLKKRTAQGENILQNRQTTLALEFERGDSTRRLRFVLCELLLIGMQVQECQKTSNEFFVKSCDLFDNDVYIPEVCDVINIGLAELPAILSIHDITQILLHVKHGPDIICCIAANFPDHFNDICVGLIVNSEKIEDDNGGARIRMATLTLLCRMNPQAAYFVRSKCVEMCKMAALTVSLTLEFPHCFRDTSENPFLSRAGDIVSFVSGLLLGTDQHVRNWFTAFTRARPKKNKENNAALLILREELIYQLKATSKLGKENQVLEDSHAIYCTVLFRLYCALRGIAGVKFQDNEVLLLMELVTVYPPPTIQGVRFAAVAICMLIACPSLLSSPENEIRCTQWLKWLSAADSPFFGKPTSETSSFSEMLLLLAIHIHSNQVNPISDLVCTTLGMKVSVRTHNMPRIKTIFIQEVFTEQVVASRAVKVLVTPNLSSNISGFLPIHCIHQLMKSRAFTKYKINVKDWIYKQICASIAPMHPLLPSLIEVYVHSMLTYSFTKVPYESVSNEPITEEEINRVFKKSSLNNDAEVASKNLMPQLLLLYYVLQYEKVRLSNNRNYPLFSKDVKSYSLEFLSAFPIKYLILQAQKEQKGYSGILPSLLRLLLAHFPHLQFVEDWLNEEDSCVAPVLPSSMSENILSAGLKSMSLCPSQASRVLHYLLTIPAIETRQYVCTFVECMPCVLNDQVPRYIQELYTRVWLRYNGLLPCALWTMTMNALQSDDAKITFPQAKVRSSIIDPLQILRCDERVYRCPPIVGIIIRILQSSLAASRSQLNRHLLDRPCESEISINNEREELKTALIAAQESAAIQILLDVCRETKNDKASLATFWSLSEIRSLICSYIHQAFIADPRLAQLVHFQGYPLELLPITVAGIPSMHICAEFIPEIINQPSLEKQSFAVNLISHVSLQFAIPYTREMATLAINTLYTLLKVLTTEARTYLFVNILPALVRICQAFPPFAEDVFPMLISLGKLCISDASFNTGILYDRNIKASELVGNCNLSDNILFKEIVLTFEKILITAIFNKRIYAN